MVKKAGVPAEWHELIHPRRGGIPGPAIVPDEDAARRARDWLAAARPIAEEMLGHERTDPELGKAVQAWLDGDPDPAGAAAVASIAVNHLPDVDGAAFLDAWVLDHGLAFAACAVTEASSVALGPAPRVARPGADGVIRLVAYMTPSTGWRGEIRRSTSDEYFGAPQWIAEDAVTKRLRTLLAAAPETEYRDAVARLSAHRGDALRRRTASYLVPTESAWTSESLQDMFGGFDHEHVLCSLSTAAHAERIGWTPVTPAVIGTLLDGLGSNALPLLERTLAHAFSSTETRRIILKALLKIPDEIVFHMLVDYTAVPDVPATLKEAADRHPVQAMHALAPLAGDGTTRGLRAAGILRELLHTDPDLRELLPPGPAESLAPRPPVPDCTDLPDVLAGKPSRTSKAAWADPALLPRILTRGRDRALPAGATRSLLNLLAATAPDVSAVRDFCDRHSLAEFSWALFERWHVLGAPTKHRWAMTQLGLLGDDTTVRRLSPLIRSWPGESATARATAALDVLARIGSDVALTHLFELTRRGKYKGLKAKAARTIDQIAAARGITPDALADRAVPDFGLDAEGTLTLDYGPRRFTVTFDQQLVPLVVEPNGKVRKSAPKPGPKDDPTLAPAAHALFTGLRKDLRTIADQEIRRLELAMITRRSWTPDDLHALFVTHPLLGHIARRLVWITDGGTAFRVAEDRTYADVHDDPFTPPPDARVSIAHPILLDDLDTWSELFADYEILQPFEQLGRPFHRLTDDERTAHRLTRLEGLVLPYGKAKGHSQGRWESLNADGEFAGGWLARRDPTGLYVIADLTPGLDYYMYGSGEDQEISALWAGPAPSRSPENPVPLGDVDPVTMSEAIHDLTRSAL
ncbi:DUF4132 domain-containing protein [Actinomadura fibrosa]|uniref:DUF4132 domain-containing protein n=1 Tax=Actinomadura fibrosa TaxID=111802 RepID=A0ABW2XHD6_9ACTN|nr:DUF4132 domain-containing protein [Actinomadura fibrosa]